MSGRTRIKLPWQTKVSDDIDLNDVSLRNLVMPEDKTTPEATSPNDVINRQYVEGIVGTPGGGAIIGDAEDGTYTDGLFVDFSSDTLIGTAVDRFNEVLKALAPSPAPNLDNISIQDSGITGKLSFGSSNNISGYINVPAKDVGGTFGSAGSEAGIFAANRTINGVLADSVSSASSYPANSFGEGDKGSLHLEVNGAVIHSVDLSAFGSGSSTNSNGSGFTSLTAATPVQFDSGDTLDLFKYRRGNWTVDPADQVNGYNFVRIRHEYETGLFRDTNYFYWVIDADTTATSFSGETISNINMNGTKRISGVTYHTSGTLDYDVTISNAYRNTYSQSSSALDFSGTKVQTSDMALPTPSTEEDDIVISGRSASLDNSGRIINETISVGVTVDRTVQGDVTSSGQSTVGFLLDNVADNSTDTLEPFNGEGYRLNTSINIDDTSYGSGGKSASAYDWDSSQHLINGDASHNTGLLISAGSLSYPNTTNHISGINGGNFSSVPNGPGGNPDYQTASGERTYLRYFYSPLAYSNFKLNVSATSTNFVTVATGPSGNNVTLEVLAPNTTKDNGGTTEWKDAVEPHNANDRDIGCFASTFGDTIPTNWGLTLGAENTSTSGNVIVIRITAASGWTGSIDSIELTWI
jgi:hypothetical protein